VDRETRDALMRLTAEVSRLSTLMERHMEADDDKETRLRRVEKWMNALPVAYVLTLGTVALSAFRMVGK